jgi:uncharacterized membrane protein YfcA
MDATHLAAAVVVLLAGFMRGITGFGGAMLMAPPLSFLLGPVSAVVIALTLEAAAAVVMFPDAWAKIKGRVLLYLTVPACFTVPIGGYLLVTLDPVTARKVIAGVVAVFSLALLSGWRYAGSPRPVTSVALGSLVGILLGATSVGAPPVILYLLSGPDPQAVTRANLAVFVTAISVIGLVMLATAGAITAPVALLAAALAPLFLLTTWLGGKLFVRLSDLGVRQFALAMMLLFGIVGLVL